MKESFARSHIVKKEKPTKSPREPPKLETKVRKSITHTWDLCKEYQSILGGFLCCCQGSGFESYLPANGCLKSPNGKVQTKVHIRLLFQVIDPDGDEDRDGDE